MLTQDLIYESNLILEDDLLCNYTPYDPLLSFDSCWLQDNKQTRTEAFEPFSGISCDAISDESNVFPESINIEKELESILSCNIDTFDQDEYLDSYWNLTSEEDNSLSSQLSEEPPNNLITVPLFTRASAKQFQVYYLVDENRYQCPFSDCRRLYAKPSHLKAHLRRHNGDKPFPCTWVGCTWRFSRSDELARHRRSHSGVKPYQCTECGKKFARSDHLNKHGKVHRRKELLAVARMKKMPARGRPHTKLI